jgi:hypothetical protein
MKTPRHFPLAVPQFGYISRYADVPAFCTQYSVRGTFRRLKAADLPVAYCVRLTVWWFLRSLIVHRRELSF